MANIFKNFKGVLANIFQVGGPQGHLLKDEATGLSVRDSSDAEYGTLTIKQAGAPNQACNLKDVLESSIVLEYSFNGSSPPVPGSNPSGYGICHTSGGIYSAGEVYLDTGSTLELVRQSLGQGALNLVAFIGAGVAMNAFALYIRHSTNPVDWTLISGGGGGITDTSDFYVGTSEPTHYDGKPWLDITEDIIVTVYINPNLVFSNSDGLGAIYF